MAATTKAGLLEVTRKEYDKFIRLIAQVDGAQAMKKVDDISFKDVVCHRAHWIELFLGWYQDGQKGYPVYFPAVGYKWNDLKRYNSDLRKRQENIDWTRAKALLDDRFGALISFIEGLSEAGLYGGPMKGANNQWTPGRWAEAAGASHFRSAAKYIRAGMKVSG